MMLKIKVKMLKYSIAIVSAVFLIWLIAHANLFLTSSNLRDNQDPIKQKEMTTLVLEWGRLAPFPANSTNVTIKTEGGSFTRSFRASFVAPKQDIQDWTRKSSGITETTPEEISDNIFWYSITPSGDANKAEVTINYILNKVDIYVSWN